MTFEDLKVLLEDFGKIIISRSIKNINSSISLAWDNDDDEIFNKL